MLAFLFLLEFKIQTHYHFQQQKLASDTKSLNEFILNEEELNPKHTNEDPNRFPIDKGDLNAEDDFSDIETVDFTEGTGQSIVSVVSHQQVTLTGRLIRNVRLINPEPTNVNSGKAIIYLDSSNFNCTMNKFENCGSNSPRAQIIHVHDIGNHYISGTQFYYCGTTIVEYNPGGNYHREPGPSLIYCEGGADNSFTGTKFMHNSPEVRSLLNWHSGSRLSIQQSKFFNSSTTTRGGAIDIMDANGTLILDTTFEYCTDFGQGTSTEGNAINFYHENRKILNITKCVFKDCNQDGQRKAHSIILLDVGNFVFEDNYITFTRDEFVAPFLRMFRPGLYQINRNTFKNIYDSQNNCYINSEQFSLCIHYDGDINADPVFNILTEEFHMNGNIFDNITCSQEGRCMRLRLNVNNDLVFADNQVINCKMNDPWNHSVSSFIYIRFRRPISGTFTFQGCSFINNVINDPDRKWGSMVFICNLNKEQDDGIPRPYHLVIDGCTFSHCENNQKGGALQFGGTGNDDVNFHTQTTMTLNNCTFEHSISALNGGAFCFIALKPLEIVNCIFRNNTGNGGAAVYIQSFPNQNSFLPQCTIRHCTFLENHDTNTNTNTIPATIVLNNEQTTAQTDITISDCTFTDNLIDITNNGYCILAAGKTLTIERNSFNNTDNQNSCGAIRCLKISDLTIDGNDFIKCNPYAILYQTMNEDPDNALNRIIIQNSNFDNNAGLYDGISIKLNNFKCDDVTLSNLKFLNHNTDKYILHAIYGGDSLPKLNLTELNFTNNTYNNSLRKCGGTGIHIEKVQILNFENCQFNRNHSPDDNGGAINIEDNDLEFSYCEFNQNYVSDSHTGGACYFGGTNKNVTLQSCTFDQNIAGPAGGAISAKTSLASFKLYYCTFINCTAQENSFVSMTEKTQPNLLLEIIGCTFKQLSSDVNTSVHFIAKNGIRFIFRDNTFDDLACIGEYGGSGLYIDSESPDTVLEGCSFLSCQADKDKSQFCVRKKSQQATTTYTFIDCTFSYTKPGTNTRAVYIYENIPVTFHHCNFDGYTNGGSGFAVKTDADDVIPEFVDCEFQNLIGQSLIECPFVQNVTFTGCAFENCSFTGDQKTGLQGTIIEAPSATIFNIMDNIFRGVRADNGAIKHKTNSSIAEQNVSIEDNEFSECTDIPLRIDASKAKCDIINNTFTRCRSDNNPSAIEVLNSIDIKILKCTFQNNGKETSGNNNKYIIDVSKTHELDFGSSEVTDKNTIIYTEDRYAGGLKSTALNTIIQNSDFIRLHEDSAIDAETENGQITIANCLFDQLQGKYQNTKIKFVAFNVTSKVNEIVFRNNTIQNTTFPFFSVDTASQSKTNNYGIGRFSCPRVTLDYCQFLNNKCNYVQSTKCGGGSGIILDGSVKNFTITNCLFSGNRANVSLSSNPDYEGKGGGFYFNYPACSLTIEHTQFNHNIADREGGGLSVEQCSSCSITNCTFSNNIAAYQDYGNSTQNYKQGGAISFNNTEQNKISYFVSNCTFAHNSAAHSTGHALSVSGSNAYAQIFQDCIFNSNSAQIGSQIVVTSSGHLDFTESTISLDKDQFGRAIETSSGAEINVHHVTFTNISTNEPTYVPDNVQDGNAILIHADSGLATIANNTFIDCYRESQKSFIVSCKGPMLLNTNNFTFSDEKGCGCILVNYNGTSKEGIQIVNNQFLFVNSNSNPYSALYVYQACNTIIENNTFDSCDGTEGPACYYIHLYHDEDVKFNGNHIQNNHPSSTSIGQINIHGLSSDSIFTFDYNEFINNTFSQRVGGGAGLIFIQSRDESEDEGTDLTLYTLELTQCQFIGNNAPSGGGFQIGFEESTSNVNIEIRNCIFDKNTAENGGALSIQIMGTIFIEDCTFTGNEASNYGAIYFNPNEIGFTSNFSESISISNCVFEKNKALRGQAIYFENGPSTSLYVDNCNFTDNPNYGDFSSSIEISSTICVINTKYFLYSNSTITCIDYPQRGYYNEGGLYDVINCTFINNHLPKKEKIGPPRDGAAVFIASKSNHSFFSQCTFEDCGRGTSSPYTIEARNPYLTITDCNFTFTYKDLTSIGRGAVYLTAYAAFTFTNNNVTNILANEGAIKYTPSGNNAYENVRIEGNIFDTCAGTPNSNPSDYRTARAITLKCYKPSNLKFCSNTIQNCPQSKLPIISITFHTSIVNSTIETFTFDSITLRNLTTSGNKLGGGSGLMIFTQNSQSLLLEMANCVFDELTTDNGTETDRWLYGRGGAWQCGNYFAGSRLDESITKENQVTITNCNFTNNQANNGGALSLFLKAPISISGCYFKGNRATMDGGAIHIPISPDSKYIDPVFNLEGTTFVNNAASHNQTNNAEIGHALHANYVFSTIINCNFTDNFLVRDKCLFTSVALTDSRQEHIESTVFQFSQVNESCPGLYLRDTNKKQLANVTNCRFIRCSSSSEMTGTAIYVDGTQSIDSLYVDRCNFLDCGSGLSNVSVIHDKAQVFFVLTNSVIEFTEDAPKSRGFYSNQRSHISIRNTSFIKCGVVGNDNDKQGGAIEYAPESPSGSEDIEIENCTFDNNSAPYTSCIYLQPRTIPTLSRLIIQNHYSTNFTLVIVYPDNLQQETQIRNCTFRNNYFSKENEENCGGSGIWIAQNHITSKTSWPLTFLGCLFESNGCAHNGGAFAFGFKSLTSDDDTLRYIYLNISECIFLNNTCEGDKGGALYLNPSSEILIDQCTFKGNNAKNGAHCGHCIYFSLRANGKIRHSAFIDNEPYEEQSEEFKYETGYSQIHIHTSRSTSIENCTFRRSELYNLTSRAIDIDYPCPITIANCSFVNLNTSDLNGACIHYNTTERSIFDDQLEITGCTFSNNDAGNGCTLYLNLSNVPCIHNNLIMNHRSGHYIFSVFFNSFIDSCTIEQCTFRNCTTSYEDGGGSGIWVANEEFISNGRPADLIFDRCIWERNDAFDKGGALHYGKSKTLVGVSLTFDNCQFTSNRGYNCGGALSLITKSPITITSCKFKSNQVIKKEETDVTHAASIYIDSTTPFVSISSCIFEDEIADQGNAIFITRNVQTCFISDCTFTRCARNENLEGTIVISQAQELLFENNTMTFRRSWCRGISILTSAVSTISQCNFNGCQSNEKGGCIFLANQIESDDPEDITIEDCTFSNCDSRVAGCAMFLNVTTTPAIRRVSIKGISRTTNWKSILELQTSDESMNEFMLDSCTFDSNIIVNDACQDGGGSGIFIARNINSTEPYQLIFNNCTWTENRASYGGAFSCGTDRLFDEIQLEFIKCTFVRNTATADHGGALYIKTKRRVQIEDCTFNANTCGDITQAGDGSAKGGALCIELVENSTDPVVITGTRFTMNRARGESTGVYIGHHVRSINLENCEFISNCHATTKYSGSQLLCESPSIEAIGVKFDFELSSAYGRHVKITSKAASSFSHCQFLNANNSKEGGGLYVKMDSRYSEEPINESFVLEYCTFSHCYGSNGACCFVDLQCSPAIRHNIIKNNQDPNVYKFCIFFRSDNRYTTLTNCSFENNVFDPSKTTGSDPIDSGGIGLWIANQQPEDDANMTVLRFDNCKFIENHNLQYGGALSYGRSNSLYNTSLIFTNCIFKNNHADKDAGALYIETIQPLQISSCEFITNTVKEANHKSSNILINPTYKGKYKIVSVSITDTTFNGISQQDQNAASALYCIENKCQSLTMEKTYFNNGVTKGNNYAVYAPVPTVVMSTVEFNYEETAIISSQYSGSGIYIKDCSSATLSNIKISNCFVPDTEAAIRIAFVDNEDITNPQLSLDSIEISRASTSQDATRAAETGHSLLLENINVQPLYLRNLRFKNCITRNYAFQLTYGKLIQYTSLIDDKFEGCDKGFNLVNPKEEGKNYYLIIHNCHFDGITNGNAFNLGSIDTPVDANISITNSYFINNKNREGDCGAFMIHTDYPIEITECHFANNEALNYGAMYLNSNDTLIQSTTILNNKATGKVGGLHVTNRGDFSIIDANISFNKAPITPNLEITHNGEAVYIDDTYLIFTKEADTSDEYNQALSQIYINGDSAKLIRIGTSYLAAPNEPITGKPIHIYSDFAGTLEIPEGNCIDASQDNSIYHIGTLVTKAGVFNCKAGGIVPEPTIPPKTDSPTQSASASASATASAMATQTPAAADEGSSTEKEKEINIGLIAGIAAGVIVLAAIIVIVIILILRRRNDVPEDSDNASEMNDEHIPQITGITDGDETPIWAGNDQDNNEIFNDDDGQMLHNDFEESWGDNVI